ncbi:MAG: hypothetical protein LBK66_06030 [Spirochaetaceae bacterium]|jgi:hypothetical protein|nr:hypothetical protein [Spirochaetaceae bacterium]
MKKQIVVIALALLSFIAVGTVFAEILQCKDPVDGTITVNFLGNSVSATYSGKSAQTFQVVVLLKDETTEYLTFSFPRTTNASTRQQHQQARGPIEKVTNCSFKEY